MHRSMPLADLRHTLHTVRRWLPRGGLLPLAAWRQRHCGIVVLLWLHVVGFAAFALASQGGLSWHAVSEFGTIGVLAALASAPRLRRRTRTLLASAGLITSSALLVHLSNGVIEAHFHFFVAVAVIALYEEWRPFFLAQTYVLLHHGVVGTLAPSLVYNHPDAWSQPWAWAVVHAAFILAASAASIVHWRLSELDRERATAEHGARVRAEAQATAAQAEIAGRKQVEAALQQQAALLAEQAHLLDLAQDAMFVWELESGAIRFWNRGAEELYGWPRAEVLGRTPQAILQTEFPSPLAELRCALERAGRWEGELIHRCRDGTQVVVNSRWALQEPADGRPATALAINSDITDQKRARAELERQARHDALTGLPNRVALGEEMDRALAQAAATETPATLLMLDLDHFKDVNDTLGHAYGDGLLREVGPRLRSALGPGETLARLGGDEFAVLLPGTSPAAAERVARDLLRRLEPPFVLGDSSVAVGGSIGLAVFPEHGADPSTLLRCADVAMYVAKRAGGGVARYRAAQDEHSRERLALAGALRRAIEHGELVLHYQPKVACATGELVGVEALVRWQHPERGLLAPDQFIPLAEQTGLIVPLGRCVIAMAVRQQQRWQRLGLPVPVAVNLCMREILDPDLPATIERELQAAGVEASLFRVEITESSLMLDPVRVRATLEHLRELGVRLAVDDYGVGYSSLRYLQQLPVDELKIDASFIRHLATNASDLTIVRSTVELAHGLGLQVVAEGVEDAATLEQLANIGCDQAQGYLLGRPQPAWAVAEWLHQQAAAHPSEGVAA